MQDVEYVCLVRSGSWKLESITCPTRCGSFGSTCARNVRKTVLHTEASVGHALPRGRLRAWPKRGQLEWYLSRTTSTYFLSLCCHPFENVVSPLGGDCITSGFLLLLTVLQDASYSYKSYLCAPALSLASY